METFIRMLPQLWVIEHTHQSAEAQRAALLRAIQADRRAWVMARALRKLRAKPARVTPAK